MHSPSSPPPFVAADKGRQERCCQSFDEDFLVANFEPAVLELRPFFPTPKSGISQACMELLVRDITVNSLGCEQAAQRYNELQVRFCTSTTKMHLALWRYGGGRQHLIPGSAKSEPALVMG